MELCVNLVFSVFNYFFQHGNLSVFTEFFLLPFFKLGNCKPKTIHVL